MENVNDFVNKRLRIRLFHGLDVCLDNGMGDGLGGILGEKLFRRLYDTLNR